MYTSRRALSAAEGVTVWLVCASSRAERGQARQEKRSKLFICGARAEGGRHHRGRICTQAWNDRWATPSCARRPAANSGGCREGRRKKRWSRSRIERVDTQWHALRHVGVPLVSAAGRSVACAVSCTDGGGGAVADEAAAPFLLPSVSRCKRKLAGAASTLLRVKFGATCGTRQPVAKDAGRAQRWGRPPWHGHNLKSVCSPAGRAGPCAALRAHCGGREQRVS